jgi:general stress protein CsbA
MSSPTPLLVTALQIVSTLFFLVVVSKFAKVKIDRLSFAVLLGLSIFLGYFLFWVVEVLVVCLVIAFLARCLTRRSKQSKKPLFVPPELEEFRRLQDERGWRKRSD